MRNYEAMFIFRPQLEVEQLEKEVKAIEKVIKEDSNGRVNYQIIGKKTFAYPIKKQREGHYVNYNFGTLPTSIKKIKENLKHRDNILRFIIFSKETKK